MLKQYNCTIVTMVHIISAKYLHVHIIIIYEHVDVDI